MTSGTECQECTLGMKPNGDFCECSFGVIQAQANERQKNVLNGHGEPLPVDIIPARYRDNTVKGLAQLFDLDGSKLVALAWVSTWGSQPWAEQKSTSLFLSGPVGTGKTTLSMLALSMFLKNGHRGQVVYYSEWVNHLAGLDYQPQALAVEEALTVPVLVIDDLGSQDRYDSRTGGVLPETARRMDIVRSVINGRMNRRVPTIITSNLTLTMIAVQFGDRVASRIDEDYKFFQVNGVDLRKGHGVNA